MIQCAWCVCFCTAECVLLLLLFWLMLCFAVCVCYFFRRCFHSSVIRCWVVQFGLVCPYLVTGLRQMYRKTVNKNEPLRSREWSTARSHAVSIRYDIYKTFKMCGLCVFSVCMCVNYGFFFLFWWFGLWNDYMPHLAYKLNETYI